MILQPTVQRHMSLKLRIVFNIFFLKIVNTPLNHLMASFKIAIRVSIVPPPLTHLKYPSKLHIPSVTFTEVCPGWPRMTPRWPRMTLGWCRRTQDDARWPQGDPRVTQDNPRVTKDDPRVTSGWPMMTPGWPRMTPRWPKGDPGPGWPQDEH